MLDFVAPGPQYRYFTTASWPSWIRFRSCVARHLEMSESALSTSAAMLFERDDARVLEAFRRGEFDYVDAIGEVSEADFFRVFHCPIGFSIGTSPIVPHWWTIGALGLLLGMTYQ